MKKYILHSPWKFLLLLTFKTLNIGVLLGFSFLVRNLINLVYAPNPLEQLNRYIPFCLLYAVLLVALYCISSVIYSRYYNTCIYLLKKDYLHALLNSSYENIVKKDSAYYISALTNDVTLITNNYVTAVFIILEEGITLLGAFVCVMIFNKIIALIMMGIALVISIIPLLFKEIMNKANNKVSEELGRYTTGVKDVLGGIDVVKTYQLEEKMNAKVENLNKEVRTTKIQRDYKGIILSALTSSTTNVVKMGLIILTIYYVTRNKLDIGSVSAILTLTVYFFAPIMSVTNQVGCIMGSRGICKKYFSIMDSSIEKKGKTRQEKNKNHQKEENPAKKEKRNLEKGILIQLEEVAYSYDESRTILQELTLSFQEGKKYLIMGESGGGKSTLLKLLSKMYTNYEGNIYLQGKDYCEIAEEQINELITYSHQKMYLFQGTIKENIDLNHTNQQEQLQKCIHICQLDSLINKLSGGINTKVSEEVNRLSEGEKLRIGLARTLYKDNPILLLDEITASLDSVNSLEIEKMILEIKDKTIINICHKFLDEIAARYDEIVIIENGRVAARGDYQHISENPLFQKYKFQRE